MAEGLISCRGCQDHLHGTGEESCWKELGTDGPSKSEDAPHATLDGPHGTDQIAGSLKAEETDSPEKSLFGALSTLVEFVSRKLPPTASRNLLQEMSTSFSALQATPQNTTGQPRLKPVTNLPDPCLSDGSHRNNDGAQNKQLRESNISEEGIDDCNSSEECVDLTLSSDDSDHSEYSPSDHEEEEEEDSPSITMKRPKTIKSSRNSSKKLRLQAKCRMGVNDRFPPFQTRSFVRFLGSPAGGLKSNVKEVDSAVSRCLHYLGSGILRWSNLLKLRKVSDWLDMHASFGDGPSALINKIYYIQTGLKYLRYLSDDDRERAKCLSASQELSSWSLRYRPLLRKRQSMIRDAMCEKDDDMTSLKRYTDMVNDQSLRGKAWDMVNKGRSGFTVARDEFLYVMRYCLTMLLVKNAKRPGVLAGMKLDEWESRRTCPTGLKLVLVSDHKTACSGSSHVYVEAQDESLIAGYISHIRPCAQNAGHTGFVFINFTGTQLQNVSSQIRKFVPAGTKFSATKLRKVYSTCVGELGNYLKEKQVAELCDHSQETQQRYYAARRKQKQTAEAYDTLQSLRNDSVRESSLDTPAKESLLS